MTLTRVQPANVPTDYIFNLDINHYGIVKVKWELWNPVGTHYVLKLHVLNLLIPTYMLAKQ